MSITHLTCQHYHHCWVYDHRKVVQLLLSLMLLLWSHQHFPKKTKKIRRWILQKVHTHCRKPFIHHETPVILQTLIQPSRVDYCIIHAIYLPSDSKYYLTFHHMWHSSSIHWYYTFKGDFTIYKVCCF